MELEEAKEILKNEGYYFTKITDAMKKSCDECAEGYEKDEYKDCLDCHAKICVFGMDW